MKNGKNTPINGLCAAGYIASLNSNQKTTHATVQISNQENVDFRYFILNNDQTLAIYFENHPTQITGKYTVKRLLYTLASIQ